MRLDEPGWWYAPADRVAARLLAPAAWLYDRIAARRWRSAAAYRSTLAVICIGNFTAGGTGKTPLAVLVATMLRQAGERPVFLSRGHGGSNRGPHLVDPARDTATEVGDEPLLLARVAPVVVARDRAAGARAIETRLAAGELDASVVIMDDGLQNPSLAKDLTLAVVDGHRGFGNGRVIPAGPLREELRRQLARVDAIVVNVPPGGDAETVSDAVRRVFTGPLLQAAVAPTGDLAWIAGTPLVAFAGIGNPTRFFNLVRTLGGRIRSEIAFPDHHPIGEAEASRIIDEAKRHRAAIVTTEKDLVRLDGGSGACAALRELAGPLPIRLEPAAADRAQLLALLRRAVTRPSASGGQRA